MQAVVHCALGQGGRRTHHLLERPTAQEINVLLTYYLRDKKLTMCQKLWHI